MDFWTSYMIYLAVVALIGGGVGWYFIHLEKKKSRTEKHQ